MELRRRRFRTPAGWCFAHVPGAAQREAKRNGALQTPISGLPEIGDENVRKSGKPDLRGPPQSVAVPDQRCHSASKTRVTALVAPPRYALHRVRDTRSLVQSLYFPVFLQIRTLPSPVSRSQAHTPPRSRGAFFAPGVCILASLTPNRGVGGAPRNVRVRARHPWGTPSCVKDARERAYDAACHALARRLASHSASRRA